MADRASITKYSRRTVLAGGPAAAASALAMLPTGGGGDGRVAALARQYRQAAAETARWIAAVERRHGPCAYDERPELRRPYAALLAREDRITAALAAARPDGVTGLAIKLRAAFYCDDLRDTVADHNPTLLIPALGDLERLAGGRSQTPAAICILPRLA